MKKKLNHTLQLQLVLGALGFLLNMAVVLAGHQQNGLPKPFYLPALVLPGVALVGLVLPVWRCWDLNASRKYLRVFTASVPAASATVVAALGILVTSVLDLLGGPDKLSLWRCITGILGSLGLLLCAWCRLQGKRPVWLCWGLVSVHIALLLLSNYRLWSREVELNGYLYQLLACVNIMLSAYQQAAADGGVGSLRSYIIIELINVALCPMAMMGSPMWLFYLCMWVYHVLNLYCLNLHKPEGE